MSRPSDEIKARRKSPPWFKCYPEDYLDGTRQLTLEQRGMYFDFLCLIYKNDGPLKDDDRWISHQMHVHWRTWRTAKKVLMACGKVVSEAGMITNVRASREVQERLINRSEVSQAAFSREAKKRQKSKKLNGTNDGGAPPCRDGGTSVPLRALARDPDSRGETSERDSNVRDHHQPKESKQTEKAILNFRPSADDDDRVEPLTPSALVETDKRLGNEEAEPVRSVSPSIVAALKAHAGEQRGGELLREYMASDYAKNARLLDKAFIGWLRKTYSVVISGAGNAMPSRGEVLDLCPKDERGRPNMELPKTVTNGAGDWKARARLGVYGRIRH